MDYPKVVKKLRKTLLLTQEEFAKEIGVSFASVNRWENGKCEPTMKAMRKIRKLCIKNEIEE